MTDAPRAAGVVPVIGSDELEWSDELRESIDRGRLVLPSPYCWAWNAEAVALSYWFAWTPETVAHLRGYFGGGHVSAVVFGSSRARHVPYGGALYSASRWLTEPLEGADALAAFGNEVRYGCELLRLPKVKGSPGSVGAAVLDLVAPRMRRPTHEVQQFAELAIYGGRNEAWRVGRVGRVSQWDRSSAYAAHLYDPLPVARSERLTARPDLRLDGVSLADVEAPRGCCRVPVLPVRAQLNDDTVTVWPWGRFCGAWTHEELRAAVDRGYRVRLRTGMTWTTAPHREYRLAADRLWNARAKWPLAKRAAVALVGRLHAGRVNRRVIPFMPHAGEEPIDAAERLGLRDGWIVVSRDRAHTHLALGLEESSSYGPRVNMPAAATILARARLELLRVLEANADRLVACATDGVILDGAAAPAGAQLGGELGEWREELQARSGNVRGPIAYELVGLDGSRKVRVAGVARVLASRYLKGEAVSWTERASLLRRRAAGTWAPRKASPNTASVTGGRRHGRTPVVDRVGGQNRVIGWA